MSIMGVRSIFDVLDHLQLRRHNSVFMKPKMSLEGFLELTPAWFRRHVHNAEDEGKLLEFQRQLLQGKFTRRKRKSESNLQIEDVSEDVCDGFSETAAVFPHEDVNSLGGSNGHNYNCNAKHIRRDSYPGNTNVAGMEERHRRVLERCVSSIMELPEETLIELVSAGILKEDYFKIKKAELPSEKAMALISCIQSRGPDSFYIFLEILLKPTFRDHIGKEIAAEDIKSFIDMLQKFGECALEPPCEYNDSLVTDFVSLTRITVNNSSSQALNIIDCRIFVQCANLRTVYFHQKLGNPNVKLRNLSFLPQWLEELYLINYAIDGDELFSFIEKVKKMNTLCIVSSSSLKSFDNIVNYVASSKKAKQIILSHKEIGTRKRQTFFNDEHSIFHPIFVDYPYYYGYSTPSCKYNLRYFAFRQRKHNSLEVSNSSKCNWKRLCHDTKQMTVSIEKRDKGQMFSYENVAIFPYNRIKMANISKISSLTLRYPELVERLKFKHCNLDKESIERIFEAFCNIFAIAISGNASILERFPEKCLQKITVLRLQKAEQLPTGKYMPNVKNLEIMNSKDVTICIKSLMEWQSLESLTASEDAQIHPVMRMTILSRSTTPVKLPLKSLIIRNIDISEETLTILLESCLNLEVLHLKGKYKVDIQTLKQLKMLKKLTLRQVTVIDSGNTESYCDNNSKKQLPSIESLTLYCLSLECAQKVLFNCCNIENLTLFMENQDELKSLSANVTKEKIFEKLQRFEIFVNLQTCRNGFPLCLPSVANFPVLEKLLIRPFFDNDPHKYSLGIIPPTVKYVLVEDAVIKELNSQIYQHLEVLQLNRCEIPTVFFDNVNDVFPQLRAIRIIRCKFHNDVDDVEAWNLHKLKAHSCLEHIIIIATDYVFANNNEKFSCVVAEKNRQSKEWNCNFEQTASHSVDCRSKNPNIPLEEKDIAIMFAEMSIDEPNGEATV